MSLTPDQIRADFPEFSDETAYPDGMLTSWIAVALNLVNTARWGALATMGQELCTAHYLVIAARDQAAAAANGLPGQATGLLNAKSVGDVSASYDTTTASFADAGFWNATSYGQRFYQMLRMVGAGGVQLG